MRVLLSGGNARLNEKLACYMEVNENLVCLAYSGGQFFRKIMSRSFDVVLIDSDSSCVDIVQAIKLAKENNAEIVVLAEASNADDRVSALNAGAADFVASNSDLAELLARMTAIVRRKSRGVLDTVYVGDLSYTASTRCVMRGGKVIELHPTAFKLLEALIRNSPGVVWREELESIVWRDRLLAKGNLRAQIYNLRSAIDKPFSIPLVHSVSGVGYRICYLDELQARHPAYQAEQASTHAW